MDFINKTWLFISITLILSTPQNILAQATAAEQNDFFQKVRFGGSLGASFSDGFFNGFIAPKAIYDFNRYASAGAGLLGSYSNSTRYRAYTAGGSILGLFHPIPALQFSTELEELYVSKDFKLDGANKRDSYWYPALFLGLGYRTGNVTVGIRYDVLYDADKSIYGDALMPFVSVYF